MEMLRARDDLRRSEAQLRTILDNMPFWIWLKDVNGRFLLVNELLLQQHMGGIKMAQAIGKTDFDFTELELAKRYLADEEEVMRTKMPKIIEEPVKVMGENKLNQTYKAPFVDADNNLLGTFGYGHDITDRKLAEQTLLESEARFRSVFEDAGIGMVLVNQNHAIERTNLAFANMLGFEEKELIGTYFKNITYPDDVDISIDSHERLIRGELSNYQLEKRYWHKNGTVVWGLLNVSLVKSAQEASSYAIAQVQDITDRKQGEADREVLIQELGRRNAELERFAYTVSHDLKSPLVTIGGFLGFLERDAESGDMAQLRTDISSIRNAADKMRLLLDELLELSRVGRLMNPPEKIPFAEIVNEAAQATQGQLMAGQVELVVSDEFPTVIGDKTRLVEVVQNLIDNAAKFSMSQTQPIITIGVRQNEEEPIFFVQDNGIGIPPQHHEKIFDIFNKLDPEVEGTGIGLALVKRIIEVHNGRLWVESDGLGQGSTFCFTLSKGDFDAKGN
jgi:PAS domain S-box-containing protein